MKISKHACVCCKVGADPYKKCSFEKSFKGQAPVEIFINNLGARQASSWGVNIGKLDMLAL